MQHLQDKEFDDLFKDKFDQAEITPSADLWDKIDTQLSVKPRRVFPVYWMAAAIGVATVSLALLFNSGSQEIPVRLTAVKSTMKNEHTMPAPKAQVQIAETKVVPATVKTRKIVLKSRILQKDLSGMQPLALNPHHDIKELTVHQERLSLPVSVGSDTEPVVFAKIDDKADHGDQVLNENEERTDNKGIRNMGDLINYVVEKVDKNDEKIIQFKTDDDNSSLVALNIGIIRINTRKHK